MLDIVKKAVFTGVGMALITKDKIEDLGKDLARQAKLSEHDGKVLVEDLLHQSEQARVDFEARVTDAVTKVIQSMQLTPHADYEKLQARVDTLEARLAALTPNHNPGA